MGITWDNIDQGGGYSFAVSLEMMFLDAILYVCDICVGHKGGITMGRMEINDEIFVLSYCVLSYCD